MFAAAVFSISVKLEVIKVSVFTVSSLTAVRTDVMRTVLKSVQQSGEYGSVVILMELENGHYNPKR